MAKQWAAFLILNAVLASSLAFALFAPSSGLQTQLLPGKTTHGHYQIELECEACHTSGKGVEQDACLKCHERELKDAKDTHPASKFNDPTNAARLELLDAQKCVTCHKEHVEERTSQMGLTLPADYCYHCHQETLSTRPSHTDLAFDSCATAGCHNYHDNRALYENFLNKHYGEPDFLEQNVVLARNIDLSGPAPAPDAPKDKLDREILAQWGRTAHGRHDVNCTGCHATPSDTDVGSDQERWNDGVTVDICATCHAGQAEGFLAGRHGMRLDQGLSPMSPSDARLEMRHDANHRNLDCNACHAAHTYDTDFAAVDACLNCHADSHSLAYRDTGHFDAWQGERIGAGPKGSGVTCATCHMPRIKDAQGRVSVRHNQNNNLRPNEKMIREVCMNCHGLQFSIDSLADPALKDTCFGSSPSGHIESIDMAKAWFDEKERQKQDRLRRRKSNSPSL